MTTITASAPARANLLGEHTDYNYGYVLPTTLGYQTTVTLETSGDGTIRARSTAFDDVHIFDHGASKTDDWPDYVFGCLRLLSDKGIALPGVTLTVDSDVPMGMGLSSSAALTVATFRAFRKLLGLEMSDFYIAMNAHAVESRYVGVPCGIMDQMVSSTGEHGKALFLDTKTLERELIALPEGYTFCIVHSGLKHQLKEGDSGYKQRVAECRTACEALGIGSLRELNESLMARAQSLPDPVNRRVRHIYTENQRVRDGVSALRKGDVALFGKLMVASHVSQRDDYDVSVPKIDQIVESSLAAGALGSRLTGGGFGGSVISLVENNRVEAWWKALTAACDGIKLL